MKIHDVSVALHSGLAVYPGDPSIDLGLVQSVARGDPANVSLLRLGTHSGTHVDAPTHLFAGARGVDDLPLETLIGSARVVEVGPGPVIGPDDLRAAVPPAAERVLLKTGSSRLWRRPGFQRDYAYLSAEAARWLAGSGVRLVGIDYLSVERPDAERLEVHEVLLRAGVVVLEGLDLDGVAPGGYTLVCLPLKLRGADGAPARAVLIEA